MNKNPYDYETPKRIHASIEARIGDYLPDSTDMIESGVWDYTMTVDDENITYLSALMIHHELMFKYADRRFIVPLKYDEETDDYILDYGSISGYLRALWVQFMQMRKDNYDRMYLALASETDPLLNYDRTETTTTTYGHTIESDTTHGKTTTTENDGSHVDDVNVYAFNSGATGADSETRSLTIDDTTTIRNSGTDESTTEHTGTDTVTIRAYGNIGTTTLQNMQIQQVEAQSIFIAERIVRDFVNTYTVY